MHVPFATGHLPLFNPLHTMKALPVLLTGILGWLLCSPALGQGSYAVEDQYASKTGMAHATPHAPRLSPYERNAAKLSATISVDLPDVLLAEALRHITDQAGLLLIYGEDEIPAGARVSLNLDGVTTLEALHETIRGQGLKLQVSKSGHLIVSRATSVEGERRGEEEPLLEHEVSGTVTAMEDGMPLPGVNVVVKGTTIGTATDGDGSYTLVAPSPSDTLVFSFVGFTEQEVPIGGRSVIDVALASDDVALDEVLVVGYGTQRRRDLSGAVSSMTMDRVREMPVMDVDRAMAGQLPGVEVRQSSGAPGSSLQIRVRGQGSITQGTEPLYVIDGLPMQITYNRDNNPLNFLNPADIEDVQVLKDASAAAIYGSRAANGVVLITTRKGREGLTQFNFTARTGVQSVLNKVEVLGGEEYAEAAWHARNRAYVEDASDDWPEPGTWDDTDEERLRKAELAGDNLDPQYLQAVWDAWVASGAPSTDWQDEIFQTAPIQSYQLSATGGGSGYTYYVGAGYEDQEGVLIGSDFKRYSVRANLASDFGENLHFGLNLNPTLTTLGNVVSEGRVHNAGVVHVALTEPPLLPVQRADGETYTSGIRCCRPADLTWLDLADVWWAELDPNDPGARIDMGFHNIGNPVNRALNWKKDRQNIQILGTSYLEYDFTPWLSARSTVGGRIYNEAYDEFRPSTIGEWGTPPPVAARAQNEEATGWKWLNTNQLTLDTRFGSNHEVTWMVAQEAERFRFRRNEIEAQDFPTDLIEVIYDEGLVQANGGAFRRESGWSQLSFFSRLDYAFADKYLLQLNVRRDGSSRFGADHRWGTFPSASLGWVVSEEPFMKGGAVDFLKLRASYGRTGANHIGNFEALALMSSTSYVGVGGTAPAFSIGGFANRALTWETQTQLDVGLDVELFDRRLSLTADYYRKINSDLLLDVDVPWYSGQGSQLLNIGKIRNQGMEFRARTISYWGDFSWEADANVYFNRNKVLALAPDIEELTGSVSAFGASNRTVVGEPFGQFYGHEIIGVFQNQEEIDSGRWAVPDYGRDVVPGDYKIMDYDGDGVITQDDRHFIGSPWPDVSYGLTNTFAYKSLSLSLLVQGSHGAEIVFGADRAMDLDFDSNELAWLWRDAWKGPDDPGNGIGRVSRGSKDHKDWIGDVSSISIGDASYIALRNATLGYTLPQNILQRQFGSRLRTARVYASVQNAFLWTPYWGYNPEGAATGEGNTNEMDTLAPGIDRGTYPLARTLTVGVNLGF